MAPSDFPGQLGLLILKVNIGCTSCDTKMVLLRTQPLLSRVISVCVPGKTFVTKLEVRATPLSVYDVGPTLPLEIIEVLSVLPKQLIKVLEKELSMRGGSVIAMVLVA